MSSEKPQRLGIFERLKAMGLFKDWQLPALMEPPFMFHELYGSGKQMTEQEWLTSTDPHAMWVFVSGRMTKRQGDFYFGTTRDLGWSPELERQRCDCFREIVPNPFMTKRDDRNGVTYFLQRRRANIQDWDKIDHNEVMYVGYPNQDLMTWENGTIPRMARKIAGVCHACDGLAEVYEVTGDRQVRCSYCTRNPGYRGEPEWRDLPELADALEEAGCTEAMILEHLRREGGHVRGCWALELFLGT